MKYRAAILLIIVLALCGTVSAYTGNGAVIVYITRTGSCYHVGTCGYLRSKYEIALEDAYLRGYYRCSRCNPPKYTGTATRAEQETKPTSNPNSGGSRSTESTHYTFKQSTTSVSAKNSENTKSTGGRSAAIAIILILLGSGAAAAVGLFVNIVKTNKQKKEQIKKDAIDKWKRERQIWEQFPSLQKNIESSLSDLNEKTKRLQKSIHDLNFIARKVRFSKRSVLLTNNASIVSGRVLPNGVYDLSKEIGIVYHSEYGKKYHTKSCRYSGDIQESVYRTNVAVDLEPCTFCNPEKDIGWIIRLKKLEEKEKRVKSLKSECETMLEYEKRISIIRSRFVILERPKPPKFPKL